MAFLTVNDFTNVPYQLPNLDRPEVAAALTSFISSAEEKILPEILGAKGYVDFLAGVAGNVAIWNELRDGKQYQIGEEVYQYTGVKKFLKPYVYARYIEEVIFDSVTQNGVVVSNVENAVTISPATRIFNAMCEFYKLVSNYMEEGDTLYGFLYVNASVYPTVHYSDPEIDNDFDL